MSEINKLKHRYLTLSANIGDRPNTLSFIAPRSGGSRCFQVECFYIFFYLRAGFCRSYWHRGSGVCRG